jgi:hypothetical protein
MDVARLLQETWDEESAADEKLSLISLEEIFPRAKPVKSMQAG